MYFVLVLRTYIVASLGKIDDSKSVDHEIPAPDPCILAHLPVLI